MDKYKVILVDDEEEVIDVIERKIHWDMLGFDVVGSANNGVKALELVEKLAAGCGHNGHQDAIHGRPRTVQET